MTQPGKTIVVVGATGNQGGSVADAILSDPKAGFRVRAITRDPGKEKAKALASRGAEVVKANLDDASSLKGAFEGAYGAFCMTNFWEHGSPEREKAQAKNMAQAAKAADLEHVVWSTLEDTRKLMRASDARMPMLGGYRVPSYDGKAEANAHFAGVPTTNLVTSFFWENFLSLMAPKKGPDGAYAWAFPMGEAKLAGIAVEDLGKCAYGVLKAGPKHVGKTVGIVGENLTMREISDKISKGLGIGPVRYDAVEPDVYRKFGFPGAEAIGNLFQVYRDFEKDILGARSVQVSRELNPKLLNFDAWLVKNKSRFQV